MIQREKTPALGANAWVTVGVIIAAHGIKGLVRLKSFTENPCDIAGYRGLRLAGGAVVRINIEHESRNGLIVAIDGVTRRDQAQALAGAVIVMKRSALPPLTDDAVYHADLLGMAVRKRHEPPFGQVVAVHNFGAGDLLDVAISGTDRSVLLPFNRQTAPDIDLKAGVITVNPPEGLLPP